MLGKFPAAVQIAIINRMGTHNVMVMKALSSDLVVQGIASLVFDMLIKDLGNAQQAQR